MFCADILTLLHTTNLKHSDEPKLSVFLYICQKPWSNENRANKWRCEKGGGQSYDGVARRARLSRDVMYTFRQAVEIATLVYISEEAFASPSVPRCQHNLITAQPPYCWFMDVLYTGSRKDLWEINFRYIHNKISGDGTEVSGIPLFYRKVSLQTSASNIQSQVVSLGSH